MRGLTRDSPQDLLAGLAVYTCATPAPLDACVNLLVRSIDDLLATTQDSERPLKVQSDESFMFGEAFYS